MAKKKQDLTPEERLAAALVPEEEWPYALPDGWKWVRLLGGAATCMDNKRKPVNSKERANRIGEIPYYGATGQVGWIDEYLTNEELILLGEDGAPFLDILKTKAYIINGKSWVNNHAHILKSFMGHIGNLYLMYYLNNFDYRKYVSGTTRLKLTQGKMKNIPVPYPPLSEQHRLVARIESLFAKLDAAREKVQSVLDSHETRKAALLHAAFAGKLTAKWREEQGESSHAWRIEKLENLCEKITCGKTPKNDISPQGEIPYLKVYNIVNDKIDFRSKPQYISRDVHETKLKSSILKPNDVIMNIVGPPLRKIAIIPDTYPEWNMNQAIVRFRPKEGLDYHFLYYALLNPETLDDVVQRTKGVVGQANISITQSRNLKIKVPPLPEQQEIIRILGRLLAREQRARQAAEETLAAIDRMKQSILARAFRGEL